MTPFSVGPVSIGGPDLFLIAGPCVIESEAHCLKMAEAIARVASDLGIPYIFKASYDKANRTSLHSFRGPGVVEGTRILRKVAETFSLPVITDVHESADVPRVADAVDILQIPAFLCRQTDLLAAAGRSGRAVNVKKGQFVAPWDMRHAVQKVHDAATESGHTPRISLTERGASFGYGNLVVDMRSLPILREFAPVVFDATHSVQLPSASSADGRAVSGGQPQFIPVLARAAVAVGIDGLFMEVHDNPKEAKSDGANALPLENLRALLEQLLAIRRAVQAPTQSNDWPED